MTTPPQNIDDYLAALPEDQRAALERIRGIVKSVAPKAEECISYRLPTFRLNGKTLVSFGAATHHCSFYPLSAATVVTHKEELRGYDTSKGTIRFTVEKPLPASLVRKLVRTRIAENAAGR
jgi:uncharacterized protein YdhG (YjbR/CyaY superfamily)